MARINIDGEQNVEVSIKIPSQKTPKEQLEIMEAYTRAHMELSLIHILTPPLWYRPVRNMQKSRKVRGEFYE